MIKQDQVIFQKLRNVLTKCTTEERRKDYLEKVERANDISKTSEIVAMIASRFWSVFPCENCYPFNDDYILYYRRRDALLRWFAVLTHTMKNRSSLARCEYMTGYCSDMSFEEHINHFMGVPNL